MLLLLIGMLVVVIITVTTPKDRFHSPDEISAAVAQKAKRDAARYINSNRNNSSKTDLPNLRNYK
ncbi:hypothetical protein CHH48_00135 [Terribacillus saccharophilus]|uniref:Uncharacterized protein n=2 Tax=Terribacillus saccharophilus TaxID=361277 RepID=A0ABX4H410_9BACI|nr:hypothetical protein CHH56_15775 [Terribacillus saccharophilus]PAD98018.1 hypothetical protein CHH50_00135 [Terribacillus saccharophilus]PAE01794.1 hypothetical protein CHH48_00135 [Terribacillus saccharophilus]